MLTRRRPRSAYRRGRQVLNIQKLVYLLRGYLRGSHRGYLGTMGNLKVSNFIDDIYKLCGNITRDQLPIEIAYVHLYNQLDKRRVQMRLTEHNQFLKGVEKPILDAREQLVSIEDFDSQSPVAVHLLNPFNSHVTPVEIVNFNTLPGFEADLQLKCSIYGTPPKIRFSNPLNDFAQWSLKIWYEPATQAPRGPGADVFINPIFRNLVSSSVAVMCLPYAMIDEKTKEQIAMALLREIGSQDVDGSLENLFYKEISAQQQYGNNFRRPFRAGMPRGSWYRG